MPRPMTRAVRLTALLTPLAWAVAVPNSALATTPVGWAEPPSMSPLTALLLFGGVPLGLFLLIVGLTVAPSLARSGSQQQNADRWATPQWFNGPSAGGERALPASGGHDSQALVATSTRSTVGVGSGTGATAYGSGSAPGSGASAYAAPAAGHGSGSSAYAGGQGWSTSARAGQGTSTYATPGADAEGSQAHMTSGNAPESATSNTYASPGGGVPAEGDQLAAAATRGGGASARW